MKLNRIVSVIDRNRLCFGRLGMWHRGKGPRDREAPGEADNKQYLHYRLDGRDASQCKYFSAFALANLPHDLLVVVVGDESGVALVWRVSLLPSLVASPPR